MFDTVKMKLVNIHIEKETFENIGNVKTTTYYDRETGVLNDRYMLEQEEIPYIVYYSNTKSLIIQLSIPKFLYGQNVRVINKSDINTFWDRFEQKLKGLFGIIVERSKWIVQRIDVCWNFKVGNKVSDYIKYLGTKKLPYKSTYCINQSETVIYKNKSSRIMFYDKEKECKVNKQPEDIISKAEGILRMEISPSYKNIQEIYSDRKAIDVLTVNFFKIITQKVMEQISFHESGLNIMNLSYEWLSNQKINRVETVIGFNTINNYLGDTMTKEIYGSTYYARKKWGEEMDFQVINQLSDLVIDYCSIE
ncbi:hypothetical protein [Heyndrickxia oleronia]|uniref:Uncharacterized protein n=1 Tax=Heyndrickxia oleronia TaxID=38875 RepID=A0AAW6T0F2_9BACI|nr:hypothetical protein [Heyndrickxia oleronia]MDH5164499.1 hypothetical protein [Heyndrickxia oleronia]